MELTNRRFAIFLASGLTLAVVVGLLVWKVSDAGVSLNSQETELAGQPVAAADASSEKQTEEEPSPATDITPNEHDEGDENADMGGADNVGSNSGAGGVNDPLAPPNANLGGGRGGSVETSYYRPTNAVPAPTTPQQQNPQQPTTARTTAPQQTQQPGGAGPSTQPGESPNPSTTTPGGPTTVVPEEPGEPQRPVPGVEEGGRLPENNPNQPEPQTAGEDIASDAAEKAINAGKSAAGALGITSDNEEGAPKKRPEDPFSASTRVQQAPADTNGAE